MNLTEYEAEAKNTRRTRCTTCNLPNDIRQQVEDARHQDNPIPFKLIARWLKEDQGYDALPATIRNHFVAGHDRD